VLSDRGVPLPLTQTQLASAVAERAEITRNDAKRLLGVLEELVLEELGNAQIRRCGSAVSCS
jgi:nucleoid DNA-binding protein